jgi:transcriptional regulator with XRE-family HTH domain
VKELEAKAPGARLRELQRAAVITSPETLAHNAKFHRTYVGRLVRGESGVTGKALAALLAALGVSLGEFFAPFKEVVRTRAPRGRG